jgi:hypothetical protein
VVEHFAQVTKAGRLAGEPAKVGLDDEEVGRGDAHEEAARPHPRSSTRAAKS